MVSADENTPVRGSGKGKKADAPGKKSAKRASKARQKATTADPLPETQALEAQELRQEPREEPGDAPVAPAESFAIENAALEPAALEPAALEPAALELAPAETQPVETAAVEAVTKDATPISSAAPVPVEEVLPALCAADPVGYQSITDAYGDYTRKSIEHTSSFFEQLAGARSFSRAFQLQTEYAQQAYDTFVAETRKIRELHRELTLQKMKRLESLVTGKATRSR
jgi:hypothetical protein